jgi:hypothetical protein
MGHPDGAHTHGSGGLGGLGAALLVILGAALFIKAAPVVLGAAAELLHLVLIVAAVILGLAGVALAGFIAWRVHRYRHEGAARATALPPGSARAAQALQEPQRDALPPAAGQVHIHHHWHGVIAEDVAAIFARQTGRDHG